MSSVCAEQPKFLSSSYHLSPSPVLPRKLPTRRETADMCSDSPRFSMSVETLLQKFLPFNNGGDDDVDGDASDPYSSDHFRMYEFKVRRCTRSRSHDWTDCPFAHPGEKARRRDPCRFHYSGTVCPEFRRGGCSRGDSCEFAHGVFECWLHPARYRTEACKDGKNCKRKVCFFAHSPRELRLLTATNYPPSSPEFPNKKNHLRPAPGSNHSCLFCHCGTTSSPTSTLFNISHMSPPHSPPLSPAKPRSLTALSPITRYNAESKLNGAITYKDALTELMTSLESMNIDAAVSPVSAARPTMPWIDVSSLPTEDQLQFILSPSTPNISGRRSFASESISSAMDENKRNAENDWASAAGPDIGWVNDLLM